MATNDDRRVRKGVFLGLEMLTVVKNCTIDERRQAVLQYYNRKTKKGMEE